ncbi:MAG: hypothetical protein EBY35_09965 [Rhodobacteraceae bacterium]|nr:hypothetical protein [Paracoccaceae bacterium]
MLECVPNAGNGLAANEIQKKLNVSSTALEIKYRIRTGNFLDLQRSKTCWFVVRLVMDKFNDGGP